jgi:hypothetical protein
MEFVEASEWKAHAPVLFFGYILTNTHPNAGPWPESKDSLGLAGGLLTTCCSLRGTKGLSRVFPQKIPSNKLTQNGIKMTQSASLSRFLKCSFKLE